MMSGNGGVPSRFDHEPVATRLSKRVGMGRYPSVLRGERLGSGRTGRLHCRSRGIRARPFEAPPRTANQPSASVFALSFAAAPRHPGPCRPHNRRSAFYSCATRGPARDLQRQGTLPHRALASKCRSTKNLLRPGTKLRLNVLPSGTVAKVNRHLSEMWCIGHSGLGNRRRCSDLCLSGSAVGDLYLDQAPLIKGFAS